MKNFLITITRDNNGHYLGAIYDRATFGVAFDIILTGIVRSTTFEEVTADHYATNGYIAVERIDSTTEHIMRDYGFRKCDVCGAWVSPQDIRTRSSTYRGNIRRCAICERTLQATLALEPKVLLSGYHDTEDDVCVINGEGENFDLSNVLGIGIEMEANSNNRIVDSDGYIRVTPKFKELTEGRTPVFRCERDCTVQAEIISNVFTKKALYAFDWNILTDTLKLLGNDESITQVGFHVHLSKLWLGNDPKTQCLNFLKLQYFLKSYENDFMKMSGRLGGSDMDYCRFYSHEAIARMKSDILNNVDPWDYIPSGHGSALISSGNTIELRIGKSTNDPVKIANYLKLVLGIVENIKNVPFEKCYCIGRVTKLVPNEVMNYWRSKGCFLNTNATNTRGVTL